MDFDNILYVEYLGHNNYINEMIYSSKFVKLHEATLMYTLFEIVLTFELLNIGLNHKH